MRVLILGGTRFVGRLVARAFVAAGADVTLLHRGVTADLDSRRQIRRRRPLAARRPRGPRLRALRRRARHVRVLLGLDAHGGRGADRPCRALRVHLERRGLPTVRRAPLAGVDAARPGADLGPLRRGEGRLGAGALGGARERPASPSTAFRFPFILGPGNFADRESFVFSRLEAGRPILLPGDGSALNQFVYAADVARALVAALERPERSGGQAYNCTHPQRDHEPRLGRALRRTSLGVEPWIVPIDEDALGVAVRDGRPDDIVFPYPADALHPRRLEAHPRSRRRDDDRQPADARGVLEHVGSGAGSHATALRPRGKGARRARARRRHSAHLSRDRRALTW